MARPRPIPVGDATDLGAATDAKLVDNGFAKPGNPNVPPGGSPEAQAFRASQQPFTGPPEPAGFRGVRPPGGGMADRINGVAGALNDVNTRQAAAIQGRIDAATQGVKNFTAGVRNVGGAVSNLAGAVYNNPIARVGGGIVGGISAISDANDAQAAFDRGDNVQGIASGVRSVAGAASMLPGVAGLPGTVYMGGQVAGAGIDKGLQTFQGGRDLRDRIGSLFVSPEERFKVAEANRFADSLKNNTPFTAGAMPVRPAAAPAAQPSLPTADLPPEMRAARLQQATDALGNGAVNTSGLVSRQGNSFSGKNIREGFSYEDGPGTRPSTGSMSVVGHGGYGFGPNSSLGGTDAALSAARSAAADRGDFSSIGGGSGSPSPGIGGFGGATLSSDLRAKTDAGGGTIRDFMRMGLSAQQAQQAVTSEADRAERARATDIGAGVATRGQDIGSATSRYGTDVGANVSIRGQDAGLLGHRMANDVARANMAREQFNADRTYNAGRTDAGFTQGQQAIKDLHEQVAGWIPPVMQDGKAVPDTQTAARYATGMQAIVGRMGKTMKDMNETDKARIVSGMQLTDVANATATNGMTPWGTRAIQSNEPILAIRKLSSSGDYQTNRKGINNETEVIPARYIEKEGSFMGLGGRPTNRFANLIEQGAQK